MARALVPGPIGLDVRQMLSDPGTRCLGPSPRPGPIGLDAGIGTSLDTSWTMLAGEVIPPVRAANVPAPLRPLTTPEGGVRPLTSGEIAMARLLFKDAIDYSRVKVHNDEYLPFGLQPDDTAMTPNGEIYFNKKHFKEDFSSTDVYTKQWFIHEMVHVWQYQLGYPVRLRGAIRIGLGYDYELKAGAKLGDYNMESQGDLLADYFALKHLNAPQAMRQAQFAQQLALFEEVLNAFLTNPSDTANLP
jgi:hypothetical protein